MSDFGQRVLDGCYRAAGVLLAPIILMVGMMVITLLHQVFLELIVNGMSEGAVKVGMTFLVNIASLALYCGLIWFLYEFVKRKGWGLFQQ